MRPHSNTALWVFLHREGKLRFGEGKHLTHITELVTVRARSQPGFDLLLGHWVLTTILPGNTLKCNVQLKRWWHLLNRFQEGQSVNLWVQTRVTIVPADLSTYVRKIHCDSYRPSLGQRPGATHSEAALRRQNVEVNSEHSCFDREKKGLQGLPG